MESDTKPEAVGVALDVAVDVAVDVFEVEVGDGLPGADEARLEERLEECQDPVDTFTARGAIDRCAGLEAAEIAETDREIEDRTKGVEAEATEVITEKIRYAICEKKRHIVTFINQNQSKSPGALQYDVADLEIYRYPLSTEFLLSLWWLLLDLFIVLGLSQIHFM